MCIPKRNKNDMFQSSENGWAVPFFISPASVYYTLGIPIDLFTPIFAISRVAGWTAHVMEQLLDNRIVRPDSVYVGPKDQKYVPLDQR